MTLVLVVDDDRAVAELVAFKLARSGIDTELAADGEAGLAAFRALRPDAVVLDWMMPRLTGLEVCRAIRDDPDPVAARTPVLLLTAKARESEVQQGRDAGADDYVVKPFSPRDLVGRVLTLLTGAAD